MDLFELLEVLISSERDYEANAVLILEECNKGQEFTSLTQGGVQGDFRLRFRTV